MCKTILTSDVVVPNLFKILVAEGIARQRGQSKVIYCFWENKKVLILARQADTGPNLTLHFSKICEKHVIHHAVNDESLDKFNSTCSKQMSARSVSSQEAAT